MLLLALLWIAKERVPLVLNADVHLDSDLAVDGLTLAAALQGHWGWHYPGTPHMGIIPVVLSWPQAKIWGATPMTLVSGGAVAYGLFVVATFALTWRAFGTRVAVWTLVPLAFASTGTLWLSGRVTGGHLLTAAWHSGAFFLLHGCLARGGALRALALGVWCGLGLYLDQMFLFSSVFIAAAGVSAWWSSGATWSGVREAGAWVLALGLGYLPHYLGIRADPYDAYKEQFQTIFDAPGPRRATREIDWRTVGALATEHTRILAFEALPRLIAGHRLPGLESEPDPSVVEGRYPSRRQTAFTMLALAVTVLASVVFVAAALALVAGWGPRQSIATDAVRWGLLSTAGGVVGAFLINLNIYNSDNYRYLVFLLAPWCIGFGVLMESVARRGPHRRLLAAFTAIAFAVLMSLDTAAWNRGFGWVDATGWPAHKRVLDPAVEWLAAHPTEQGIFGSYWDVYRISFLTGGRVRGLPYPTFPDRFPEWARRLPGGRPRILVARRTVEGNYYRTAALREGGSELRRTPQVVIYDWPTGASRGD
jgi:hypothetical protein